MSSQKTAYQVEEEGTFLRIIFPGLRSRFAQAFAALPLPMVFCPLILVPLVIRRWSGQSMGSYLVQIGIGAVLWLAMLGLAYLWLLAALSRQLVEIDGEAMSTRRVFVFGSHVVKGRPTRRYALAHVRRLRIDPSTRGPTSGQILAFEYDDKTIHLGENIDRFETMEIWRALQRHVPGLGESDPGVKIPHPMEKVLSALFIPEMVLMSLAVALGKYLPLVPAGLNPFWGEGLLWLAVLTLAAFVGMRLSWVRDREGAPALGKKTRNGYTAIFWFSLAGLVAIAGMMSITYFFLTPPQLRGQWQHFDQADGLLSDHVNGVAVDGQGNTWFATDQGVSVLTPGGEWKQYRAGDGLGSNYVNGIAIDSRGNIWVVVRDSGVLRFDGTSWQVSAITPSAEGAAEYFIRLAVDVRDNVWVLSTVRLYVIQPNGGSGAIEFPPNTHRWGHLVVDTAGDVWLATDEIGIAVVKYEPDTGQWSPVEYAVDHVEIPLVNGGVIINGKLSPQLWSVAVDRQPGHLWLATDRIVEIEDGKWSIRESHYRPYAVYVDADGYKWFSAAENGHIVDGVLLLSPDGQKSYYYHSRGTSRIHMYFDIIGDSRGIIWFIPATGSVDRYTPGK